MKHQTEWVIKQLRENGRVTRNEALKVYISRLGALICSLKKSGWNITAKNERTHNGYGEGLDYVYRWNDWKPAERSYPQLSVELTKEV